MIHFDEIKSEEGEENLLIKHENKYIEVKNRKNDLSNFEILDELGSGGFGKVFKVRYKLNNCIYALKRLQKKYEKEKVKEIYNRREIELLSQLKHPNIIKFYDTFEDEKYIYLIIEYMNNGSLNDFLKYFSKENKNIKNEIIWNFFLQCISGLTYIHSKDIMHRDINPDNILIDNNMTLKITDFGVSKKFEKDKNVSQTEIGTFYYRAPEIESKNYTEKVDIYSLGKVLQKLYDFLENSNDKELFNIINAMIKNNPNERPSAPKVFNYVKQIYNIKYLKNTSLDSLIRCLYSLIPMTSYFLNLSDYNLMNSMKDNFVKCLEAFTDEDINKWFNSLENMRYYLEKQSDLVIINKEIEPIVLLFFIFEGLNSELNKPTNDDDKENKYMLDTESVMNTDKNEAKLKHINNFFEKQNSFISNNFMGLIKEIRICKECELKTYKFKSYFCVTFDLAKMNFKKDEKINLEECFAYQKQEERLKDMMCYNCIKSTSHSCYNFFYSSPLLLIINIKNDSQDKVILYLKEILDLKEHIEFHNLPTKFTLKGILKQKNGFYISNINIENTWFSCENKKIEKINFNPTKDTNENIIMLFYQSIK